MALVFLATQTLSSRSRNESAGDHVDRPRLSGRKSRPQLSRQWSDQAAPGPIGNPATPRESLSSASPFDPVSSIAHTPRSLSPDHQFSAEPCLDPLVGSELPSGGALTRSDSWAERRPETEELPVFNSYLDDHDEFLTSGEDEDEAEEDPEHRFSDQQSYDGHSSSFNNNNDRFTFDLNHKAPDRVDSIPGIQWPLDHSSKNRRLSNIRQQVKEFSSAIKMAIESESERNCEGRLNPNPVPFSSLVDMGLVQGSAALHGPAPGPLPSIAEVQALLASSKSKEAKLLIRRSFWPVDHPIRKELWRRMLQHLSKEEFQEGFYWDAVQQIYGTKDASSCSVVLPSFVDGKHVSSYGLSAVGVRACERIMSVVSYNYPAITFAPLVYPITALFCHYMEEAEAYHCISVLLSKSNNYINQTKIKHESMWRATDVLAHKYMKGGFSILRKSGVTQEQVSEGFHHCTRWGFAHLPLSHVIRVVDCFLLEGFKVVLRSNLALFDLFAKATMREAELSSRVSGGGFAEALASYCHRVPDSPTKLLKVAFGIRGFSKEQIKKVLVQCEASANNEPPSAASPLRWASVDEQPTSESQSVIQSSSHTLDVRELLTIWSWLPMRITTHRPTLLYTTEEHGSLLSNFYQRVDNFEPTILLVRTTGDELFGAYCSSSWSKRNERDEYGHKQTYFGTGETFLFTLRPRLAKFEWVGISQQRQDSTLSSVAHQSELFMHADTDMVTVGGGGGHGLMLDQDLRYGKTERCDTFNNEPLCSSPDFEIKVVEVFSLGDRC